MVYPSLQRRLPLRTMVRRSCSHMVTIRSRFFISLRPGTRRRLSSLSCITRPLRHITRSRPILDNIAPTSLPQAAMSNARPTTLRSRRNLRLHLLPNTLPRIPRVNSAPVMVAGLRSISEDILAPSVKLSQLARHSSPTARLVKRTTSISSKRLERTTIRNITFAYLPAKTLASIPPIPISTMREVPATVLLLRANPDRAMFRVQRLSIVHTMFQLIRKVLFIIMMLIDNIIIRLNTSLRQCNIMNLSQCRHDQSRLQSYLGTLP